MNNEENVGAKSDGEMISDSLDDLASGITVIGQSLAGPGMQENITNSLDKIAEALSHTDIWSSMPYDIADRLGSDGLNNIARAIKEGLSDIADAIRETKAA